MLASIGFTVCSESVYCGRYLTNLTEERRNQGLPLLVSSQEKIVELCAVVIFLVLDGSNGFVGASGMTAKLRNHVRGKANRCPFRLFDLLKQRALVRFQIARERI